MQEYNDLGDDAIAYRLIKITDAPSQDDSLTETTSSSSTEDEFDDDDDDDDDDCEYSSPALDLSLISHTLPPRLNKVPYSATSQTTATVERRTTDDGHSYAIYSITVKLDKPNDEVTHEIIPPVSVEGGFKINISVLNIATGGLPTAMTLWDFPRNFSPYQWSVVDHGGVSGYWKCEFLSAQAVYMGVQLTVDVIKTVDIVLEEADYGFGELD